ncbi:MAG TPA: LysR family transcriptional regulator [Chloroflexota bacterium]|jgi:DNA-binding transcriptional LysR family regulator|nr:LysR family transcriptional regulator [Chloroflexota bacterium]
MELHHLRYFVAIADRLSFSRAAEDLTITQPSLSRQMRDLEAELGAPLFNREGRSISLTAAGAAFLPAARATLAEAERARRRVRDVLSAQGGSLMVGCSPQTAATVLAPLLGRWRTAHPNVQVRIVEDGALELIMMLEDGRLDLAVVPLDLPHPLATVPFLTAHIRAVAPRGHPLLCSELVDLRGLVAPADQEPVPLLMLKEQYLTRQRLAAAWEEAGLRPYVAMESTVGQTLAAYAEAGLGIALLPETVDLRGFDLASAIVTDGDQPLVLRNGLGWNPRRYLSPAAQAFIAAVEPQHPGCTTRPGISFPGSDDTRSTRGGAHEYSNRPTGHPAGTLRGPT